jgi:primosomal protein N' (replication factor Y)
MKYADVVVNLPLHPIFRPLAKERSEGSSSAMAEAEVQSAPYAWLDQAFTYHVTPSQEQMIAPGQLVWVPFGARRVEGIVVALKESTALEETRAIGEIVEQRPMLSLSHLELARWMAHRYLAPLSECIWLMLPPGIEEKVETIYQVAAHATATSHLTEKQLELLELVRVSDGIKSTRIPVHLRGSTEALVLHGLLIKQAHVRPPKAKPKRVKSVRLIVGPPEPIGAPAHTVRRRPPTEISPKFNRVLEFLHREGGAAWVSVVYAETGATSQDLRKMERAGMLALESEEVIRDPLRDKKFTTTAAPTLTSEQEQAFAEIRRGLAGQSLGTYLLHGVTGSGKTEIYLKSIEQVLEHGGQAIALVPEIALTPQTIQRFGARFGARIGVIHSDLSYGERYDTWRRARDGKIDVIIGPRSALFAPLPRLGLIVIDEEHEPSYKQEAEMATWRLPLYHAREVALELARLNRASVILGSATPDVETYSRAVAGEFKLLALPQRIVAHGTTAEPVRYQELPPVQVVDLRAELREGNRSVLSRTLYAAIGAALTAHEQVILFLNRRGMATSVLCRTCGLAVKCPRCNNPFTLHQSGGVATKELVCHHCGKRGRVPLTCPNCGSTRVRALGLGTEKLEQIVRESFATARTLRWDRDVTRVKESHEKLLEAFTRGVADVLIGTQMIAKGLDLPRVTLVGVVNADTALNLPDFRASERTFQLLTQVAGRAGRSALRGKVIIQTYYPEHYAIAAAARHDYNSFYEQEMRFRREAAFPPFRPLVRLLFVGAREDETREASTQLARALLDRIRGQGLMDVELVGPAPAFFSKWGGKYRYHLLLRGNNARTLLAAFPLPVGCRVDVDPMNLL